MTRINSPMVMTESELRELWQNGRGALPAFPPGTRFSPAAQDFLNAHRLEVRFEAAPQPTALPGKDSPGEARPGRPQWDTPISYPVVLAGPPPVCSVCGQPLVHKPDHMAQLDAGHFAPRTSPRLKFRGRLDSLHAATLLVASRARRFNLPDLADRLSSLAAFCRELLSAEYNRRPAAPLSLDGKSETELHAISHWPDRHLGLAHVLPGPGDHEVLLWLNWLRTQVREAELLAYESFAGADGPADPSGLAHGLNRLSSAVYYLELMFKSGKLAWQVRVGS